MKKEYYEIIKEIEVDCLGGKTAFMTQVAFVDKETKDITLRYLFTPELYLRIEWSKFPVVVKYNIGNKHSLDIKDAWNKLINEEYNMDDNNRQKLINLEDKKHYVVNEDVLRDLRLEFLVDNYEDENKLLPIIKTVKESLRQEDNPQLNKALLVAVYEMNKIPKDVINEYGILNPDVLDLDTLGIKFINKSMMSEEEFKEMEKLVDDKVDKLENDYEKKYPNRRIRKTKEIKENIEVKEIKDKPKIESSIQLEEINPPDEENIDQSDGDKVVEVKKDEPEVIKEKPKKKKKLGFNFSHVVTEQPNRDINENINYNVKKEEPKITENETEEQRRLRERNYEITLDNPYNVEYDDKGRVVYFESVKICREKDKELDRGWLQTYTEYEEWCAFKVKYDEDDNYKIYMSFIDDKKQEETKRRREEKDRESKNKSLLELNKLLKENDKDIISGDEADRINENEIYEMIESEKKYKKYKVVKEKYNEKRKELRERYKYEIDNMNPSLQLQFRRDRHFGIEDIFTKKYRMRLQSLKEEEDREMEAVYRREQEIKRESMKAEQEQMRIDSGISARIFTLEEYDKIHPGFKSRFIQEMINNGEFEREGIDLDKAYKEMNSKNKPVTSIMAAIKKSKENEYSKFIKLVNDKFKLYRSKQLNSKIAYTPEERNRKFLKSIGCYDGPITDKEIAELEAKKQKERLKDAWTKILNKVPLRVFKNDQEMQETNNLEKMRMAAGESVWLTKDEMVELEKYVRTEYVKEHPEYMEVLNKKDEKAKREQYEKEEAIRKRWKEEHERSIEMQREIERNNDDEDDEWEEEFQMVLARGRALSRALEKERREEELKSMGNPWGDDVLTDIFNDVVENEIDEDYLINEFFYKNWEEKFKREGLVGDNELQYVMLETYKLEHRNEDLKDLYEAIRNGHVPEGFEYLTYSNFNNFNFNNMDNYDDIDDSFLGLGNEELLEEGYLTPQQEQNIEEMDYHDFYDLEEQGINTDALLDDLRESFGDSLSTDLKNCIELPECNENDEEDRIKRINDNLPQGYEYDVVDVDTEDIPEECLMDLGIEPGSKNKNPEAYWGIVV